MKSSVPILVAAFLLGGGLGFSAADPPAKDKTSSRAELGIEVKPNHWPGDVGLHVTLTNKSKGLLVNTWVHDRFDGLVFKLRDQNGVELKIDQFYIRGTDLEVEPKYIVLKPGEPRSQMISLLDMFRTKGRKPRAGKYKVNVAYINPFQNEKYEAKQVEVVFPAK